LLIHNVLLLLLKNCAVSQLDSFALDMSYADIDLFRFEETLETAIKTVFENEGLADVVIPDEISDELKGQRSVIQVEVAGAVDSPYITKPNGVKEFARYEATVSIAHIVPRTEKNLGSLRDRIALTRYIMQRSRIRELFPAASTGSLIIEQIGRPGATRINPPSGSGSSDTAEMSFPIWFSIKKDAWN
jgi:hypothetical protein